MKRAILIPFIALLTVISPASGETGSASSKPSAPNSSTYPIDTCVVSGKKLGSMGKAYVHHAGTTEVRFCCKGCLPMFNKAPEKYLEKLKPAASNNK